MSRPNSRPPQSAFTLVELSVVLVIIALITGMAMSSGISVVKSARLAATTRKMAAIDRALQSYRASYDRLPCPADLTIAEGATNFGVEGATAGTCTGGTPAANNSAVGATYAGKTGVEGALPVVTLGLPNDFMYDGWGKRFRYAVDKSVTANAAMTSIKTQCTNLAITIKDATSGNTITSGAIYALISSGENGHGAYTRKGVITNAGSTNTDEQTNCHCTSAAAAGTYAPTYIQKDPSINSASSTDAFDDIVTYKERWQMQVAWEKPGTCGDYLYVFDRQNGRVQKFDTSSGSFISSITIGGECCGEGFDLLTSGSGYIYFVDAANGWINVVSSDGSTVLNITGSPLNHPFGATLDNTNSNLWVADSYNHRVVKYSISGTNLTPVLYIPSDCSVSCSESDTDGRFYEPYGVNVDSSGNVWVADWAWQSATVQKFDSSGNFLLKVGVSSGSADGQFYDPMSVAFDGSGNFWVVDNGNNRLQKFNSAGVRQSQVGCASGACTASSANGSFDYPRGMVIDSSGNLWVADANNNRIQKFNSSGVYQSQIGCATGACSSSATTGSFNDPHFLVLKSQ